MAALRLSQLNLSSKWISCFECACEYHKVSSSNCVLKMTRLSQHVAKLFSKLKSNVHTCSRTRCKYIAQGSAGVAKPMDGRERPSMYVVVGHPWPTTCGRTTCDRIRSRRIRRRLNLAADGPGKDMYLRLAHRWVNSECMTSMNLIHQFRMHIEIPPFQLCHFL